MQKTFYLSLPDPKSLQEKLSKTEGVINTEIGYINGLTLYPSKADVDNGKSGHAYAIKITYDDSLTALQTILAKFLTCIDPYLPKDEKKMPTRAGFYYTNLLDGMDADSFFSSSLHEGWNIKVVKMMNFFLAK